LEPEEIDGKTQIRVFAIYFQTIFSTKF